MEHRRKAVAAATALQGWLRRHTSGSDPQHVWLRLRRTALLALADSLSLFRLALLLRSFSSFL
jgi:hypothetical protein